MAINIPEIPVYLDDNYILRWSRSIGAARKGDIAGGINRDGYRKITYKGRSYLAHRVIFQMHYGYLPEIIDHIDGGKQNNNPLNLRPATPSQSCINRKTQVNNVSGHKGVYWLPRDNGWVSAINVNNKRVHLGLSRTFDEAVRLRKAGEAKYHGSYTRANELLKNNGGKKP